MSGETFVVAVLGSRPVAMPAAPVERILPYAQLVERPSLPSGELGVLDVAGEVLRVFDAGWFATGTAQTPGLDSHLLLIQHDGGRLLFLVDSVDEVEELEREEGGESSQLARTKSGSLLPIVDLVDLVQKLPPSMSKGSPSG